MLVICAWCEREDKITVLQEGNSAEGVSHGICPQHQQEQLAEVMKLFPPKRASNPKRRRRRRK